MQNCETDLIELIRTVFGRAAHVDTSVQRSPARDLPCHPCSCLQELSASCPIVLDLTLWSFFYRPNASQTCQNRCHVQHVTCWKHVFHMFKTSVQVCFTKTFFSRAAATCSVHRDLARRTSETRTPPTKRLSWLVDTCGLFMSFPVLSCLFMSFHVFSCLFMSFHVFSCLFMSFHVCSSLFMSVHVFSCLFMSFLSVFSCLSMSVYNCSCVFMCVHVFSCPFMSFHVFSCLFMSFHVFPVFSCVFMSFHVFSCLFLSFYVCV